MIFNDLNKNLKKVASFNQLSISKTNTSYRYNYRYSLNLLWPINGKPNIELSATRDFEKFETIF
jgi:hypothetical protein